MADHDEHQRSKKRVKGQQLKADTALLRKTKLCYFHDNHPDGCSLIAEACRFAHGVEELRKKDD